MSLIKAHCSAMHVATPLYPPLSGGQAKTPQNFIVCAHSTQTRKFVLQGPQGGTWKKRPLIELTSFIIELALYKD